MEMTKGVFLRKRINMRIFLLLAFLSAASIMHSQQIELHFPEFSGSDWDFILLRGLVKDTVLSGTIPDEGRVNLEIPQNYRGYAGMGRWMLRGGGGLDMVINGEDFQVECLSDMPNDENIIYTGSEENRFLRQNYREQAILQTKYEAMQLALQAYSPDDPLFQVFEEEMGQIEGQYAGFYAELKESPLYAARFREIVNFTRGLGSELTADEYTRAVASDQFLRHQLSWPALYTSNHWSGVCFSWVQMHERVIQSDTALLNSARDILSRLEDESAELYTAFCEQVARYFLQFGKDNLLVELGPEVRESGMLLRYDGLLAQFHGLPVGDKVPGLVLPEGGKLSWEGSPAQTHILVFFESGCGHCETTLTQLKANYETLTKAGINVVTVSADEDREIYEENAASFPWREKYCDEQGFGGANFRNFGVMGTPTIFAIDSDGTLLRRSAQLPELLSWLDGRQ